jgi:hypothetical protein
MVINHFFEQQIIVDNKDMYCFHTSTCRHRLGPKRSDRVYVLVIIFVGIFDGEQKNESLPEKKKEEMEEIQQRLRDFLLEEETSLEKHSLNIKGCPTLKEAHIYCKTRRLSAQTSGIMIEKYFQHKYHMTKNSSSSCTGDLCHANTNFELKISNGGKRHDRFNFVQLRMNHNCDYLFTAYYLHPSNLDQCGELFIFQLKKDSLKNMLLQYGSYAHGTVRKLGPITLKDLEDPENQKEYALRPKYGDPCWKALLEYRSFFWS